MDDELNNAGSPSDRKRPYEPFAGHDHIRGTTRTEYIALDGRAYDSEARAQLVSVKHVVREFVGFIVDSSAKITLSSTAQEELVDVLVARSAEVRRLLTPPKNKHELESIAHKFCVDEGQAPLRAEAPKNRKLPDDYEPEDEENITDKTYDSDDIIRAFRAGAEWGAKIEPWKVP